MATLSELTSYENELLAQWEMIKEDPELTEEERQVMLEGIKQAAVESKEKIERVAYYIKSSSSKIDFWKEEVKKAQSYIKNFESSIEYLKEVLNEYMTEQDIDKIEVGAYTVKKHKNSNPSLTKSEGAEAPAKYTIIIPEHLEDDNKAIKEALKNGEEIDGYSLEYGYHVRIK